MQLHTFLNKAENSQFQLWLLNQGLWRMIPFNGPHKFRITSVNPDSINISIPFIRKNKNHINGIHACALATLCEYISGLCISRELSPDDYRIILKEIHMTYHYQAKMEVMANFRLDKIEIQDIRETLKSQDAIFKLFTVEVFDRERNHCCTGKIHWQIKLKSKISTKY